MNTAYDGQARVRPSGRNGNRLPVCQPGERVGGGRTSAPKKTPRVMARFPTSIENIALDLIFESMGESRSNRTFDDYMRIASELPPLKTLHHSVNQRLTKIAETGAAPYEICRFRAGDEIIRSEPFPTSISIETIRTALVVSGMRQPKWKRRSTY